MSFVGITLLKTNMAMERHHVQWKTHLQMVDIPLLVFGGGDANQPRFVTQRCLFASQLSCSNFREINGNTT